MKRPTTTPPLSAHRRPSSPILRRNQLIACGLLVMIISAILLMSSVPEAEAKGLKKLKKLLKMKKLKKYLPFMLMGPKIIIITRDGGGSSYGGGGSYGGSGGSYGGGGGGGGGGYDDGGYEADPGFDYGSMGY